MPANQQAPRPRFFSLSQPADKQQRDQLVAENPHLRVIDTYETQLKELFVLDNPPLNFNKPELEKHFAAHRDAHYGSGGAEAAGQWIYLPWRHVLLHLLDDEGFQKVRTGRNRNLITADEQRTYYHSTISIGGLSVGNSIAVSIVLTGGGKHLRLADPDTLELTNLNRIRASIAELTEPKVYLTARQIYELDPYADLTLYPEGITDENIEAFCDGANVIIDEIDNLDIKIKLRLEAKRRRLPLLQATDNGDSGLLDVERYDLDENITPFHGRLGEDPAGDYLNKKLPLPLLGKLIGEKLVGFTITEPRMQQSLLAIGKEIPTWPQLGGAALLNGVAVAAAVRKILTDQPVNDTRSILSLSSLLIPGYDSEEQIAARGENTAKFAAAYNAAIEQFLKMTGNKSHHP